MRICLLTNQDLDADPFPDDDWPCDPRPFLPEADWDLAILTKATSVAIVRERVAEGYDVFFNLCDGAVGEDDKPGIEVVETLEALGVPFTGAGSINYEPTREDMKRVCREQGVATPRGLIARTKKDVERAARELTFPLFVKHHNSYSSIDISRASRVVTPAGLRRQARKIMSRHGAAMIEEYIAGDECTVLVAENPAPGKAPITYTPMQYRFPEGEAFKHADLKWLDYDGLVCFPVEDPELDTRLREASAKLFDGLGGVSFGRCDMRVDPHGRVFMLEINSNCGIYYPPADAGGADLCLLHDPGGHEGFTRSLVEAALNRYGAAETPK